MRGFWNQRSSLALGKTMPSPSVISPSISRLRIATLLPKIALAVLYASTGFHSGRIEWPICSTLKIGRPFSSTTRVSSE